MRVFPLFDSITTDQPTNRPTDRWTDKASYKVASPRLKSVVNVLSNISIKSRIIILPSFHGSDPLSIWYILYQPVTKLNQSINQSYWSLYAMNNKEIPRMMVRSIDKNKKIAPKAVSCYSYNGFLFFVWPTACFESTSAFHQK